MQCCLVISELYPESEGCFWSKQQNLTDIAIDYTIIQINEPFPRDDSILYEIRSRLSMALGLGRWASVRSGGVVMLARQAKPNLVPRGSSESDAHPGIEF